MTEWTEEAKQALLEAVEWATPERFRAKGERWGAVSGMIMAKTGLHFLPRTCAARHEVLIQFKHNEERDKRQKRLEFPDAEKHMSTMAGQLGMLFGEVVAMREEMKALRRTTLDVMGSSDE